MTVPASSSLSQACASVATFLKAKLAQVDGYDSTDVLVGSPRDAGQNGDRESRHAVNLFFYGFEPAGGSLETDPHEPWRVRLQCLVTPFAIREDNSSTGDIELRLVGEVLRVFHETPILDAVDVGGETMRLEVVPHPLSSENLNHLWSILGDVSFRPSVAYEMSLAPIVPRQRTVEGPRVGELELQLRRVDSTLSDIRTFVPTVGKTVVDGSTTGWAPHVCLVDGGRCYESVRLVVGATFVARVWVAGVPGEDVALVTETWTREAGWARSEATVPITIVSDRIDPDQAATAPTVSLDLPMDRAGQSMIYAERTYARSDGNRATTRSNLLLVTLTS